MSCALSAILSRGCKPDHLTMRLGPPDSEPQARGMAALHCFTTAGVRSITRLTIAQLDLTEQAAAAVAAAAPALSSLCLADSRLDQLDSVVLSARNTLCHLSLERCTNWPPGLGAALRSCARLEHLTLLNETSDADADGNRTTLLPLAPACEAVISLTQLRSLSLDLRLPTCDASYSYEGDGEPAAAAAASLATGFSALTRLTCLDVGEAGAVPHPAWRLELIRSLASLPRLAELTWRRLECDAAALAALASSSSLTSLSVEKFRAPAPLAAVTLAATAAAAAAAAPPPQPPGSLANQTRPAPGDVANAPRSTVAASAAVAAALIRSAGAEAGQDAEASVHSLLLPLPRGIRLLRARYSGLGGMSLAALAALQLPPGLTDLELRNPKLEIGDDDVDQPSGLRLLPEAALALGLGISKLAAHCPGLHTLRIINEARQRTALAAPVGWAEGSGGGVGAAGGGHVPWLSTLGSLKSLRRLTLSGLMLGRVDVELLARRMTGLEELYLVPLGSVSSAAVPVLRGMGLRRLVLPYERHA